jgi:Ca2+-dependent lipid-binding protein
VATVNGEQTRTTSVIKKTLNPYWNESFDMYEPRRPAWQESANTR